MQDIVGRDQLELVRHRNRTGVSARALERTAARGEFIRIRSGAYVAARVWSGLRPSERARLEAAAAHDVGRGALVLSHASAAVLWEIPRIHRPDRLVHVRATARAGSRVENGFRKHAVADTALHVDEVLGIPCTSLARTVIDLALTEPFADAVVAADWALRRVTKDALQRVLDEVDPRRGRARAEAVLAFADGRSDSVGESWSRAQMAEEGFPAPLLQARFDDRAGLIGFVDFFWPELGLIGEFDGLKKYIDPALLGDRLPNEVLVAEKLREDRLRAVGPTVTRWVWATLKARGALVQQLRAATGEPRR